MGYRVVKEEVDGKVLLRRAAPGEELAGRFPWSKAGGAARVGEEAAAADALACQLETLGPAAAETQEESDRRVEARAMAALSSECV